jgi:endonuclease/exonuclease/phosphatase family metal-dependent hydrolase
MKHDYKVLTLWIILCLFLFTCCIDYTENIEEYASVDTSSLIVNADEIVSYSTAIKKPENLMCIVFGNDGTYIRHTPVKYAFDNTNNTIVFVIDFSELDTGDYKIIFVGNVNHNRCFHLDILDKLDTDPGDVSVDDLLTQRITDILQTETESVLIDIDFMPFYLTRDDDENNAVISAHYDSGSGLTLGELKCVPILKCVYYKTTPLCESYEYRDDDQLVGIEVINGICNNLMTGQSDNVPYCKFEASGNEVTGETRVWLPRFVDVEKSTATLKSWDMNTLMKTKKIDFDLISLLKNYNSRTLVYKNRSTERSIDMLSWNILHLYGRDVGGKTPWDSRKANVVKYMKYIHPDILCIQEDNIEQVNYIHDQLGTLYDRYTDLPSRNDAGYEHWAEYNTIYWNSARFEIADNTAGKFWHSQTPTEPYTTASLAAVPNKFYKTTNYVCLYDKLTKRKIGVINTHLNDLTTAVEGTGYNLQTLGIHTVAMAADILLDAGCSILYLCGDMNSTSNSTFNEITSAPYNMVFNGSAGVALESTGYESARIDRVYLSGNVKLLSTALVTNVTAIAGGYCSDHYPVYCKFATWVNNE